MNIKIEHIVFIQSHVFQVKASSLNNSLLSRTFSSHLNTFLSFASFRFLLRSLLILLQESCKLCRSRFQGEGVTLKFLSCLNGLLSIWEQLSCLESVFHVLEKRTGPCQEGLAVCIVHHTRNNRSSVVAVCSLSYLKEGLCDYNQQIIIAAA
ncbi:hypothetical protein VNO77_21634 [Canavalia gladiata]|uniref:Uncharacterized protein n=1 Tax=Canavalia gladiata TaxID=3824 RepID=A0AAN9LSG3_CANGL